MSSVLFKNITKNNMIYNPLTKRWLDPSKQTARKLNQTLGPTHLYKRKKKIIKPKFSPFKYNSSLNNNENVLDVGRSIMGKVKSKYINIDSGKFITISQSRNDSYLYKYTFKSYKNDSVLKQFMNKNSREFKTFLKITIVPYYSCQNIKQREKFVKKSPVYKEIELYHVANNLMNDNVSKSFAYCFNKKYLNKYWSMYKNTPHTILMTEDISDSYITLQNFLQSSNLPTCVLFELLYNLHTMDLIGLKHMDLHSENIYIKKLKKKEFRRYEMLIDNEFKYFYVDTSHVIKIIDFDGGSKSQPKFNNVKQHYKTIVENPEVWSGSLNSNNKTNFLKVIHTLVTISLNKNSLTTDLKMIGLKNIPFINNLNIRHNVYNSNFLKRYGFLIENWSDKITKLLKIHNSLLKDITSLFLNIDTFGENMNKNKAYITLSQRNLFTK